MAAVLGVWAAAAEAAPVGDSHFAFASGAGLADSATVDATDMVARYLGPDTLAAVMDLEMSVAAEAMSPSAPEPARVPAPVQRPASVVTYNAPAAPAAPPVRLASFEYPQIAGLADLGSGGRDVPLGDTRFFAMGPGGFGGVMQGRPTGGLENWSHVTRTAISYIRPNVNIQMIFALDVPGPGAAPRFEGPGFEPHAFLAVDRQTRVASDEIGAATGRFGSSPMPVPVEEPQTAVTAGLDLGLLPTFLAQMGLGVSIVASRGQETGNLRVALVGTTELPVDWAPRERPYQHPLGLPTPEVILASYDDTPYSSGQVGHYEPPGGNGGGDGKTPIVPVIPEPMTVALVATGAAVAALAGRKRARR